MKNKIKTLKAFSKRVKKCSKGFRRKQANKGHLLRKKNSKRKRSLTRVVSLTSNQNKLASRVLF